MRLLSVLNNFSIFFPIGIWHILDFEGYDHILFIIVLSTPFSFRDWKSLIALVTAFTLGHSITLVLSTLQIFTISSRWVEVLIPITIALTAAWNVINRKNFQAHKIRNYLPALFFGFIHGMGFANSLRSMLGHLTNIFIPLLAFNLGLEVGQWVVVSLVLILQTLLTRFYLPIGRSWNLALSLVIFFIALFLVYLRIKELTISLT